MKLETYAKIGIISGIAIAVLVGVDLTIMVLNHEFGVNFRDLTHTISEKQQEEILNSFYELPEYIAFKERYPDSRSEVKNDIRRVQLILSQYEASTQNGLELEITQHYFEDTIHVDAKCDIHQRNSDIRRQAQGGIAYDYIKTTTCVNPAQ